MSQNKNDDYADGIAGGPSREEIYDAINAYNADEPTLIAEVEWHHWGDYTITVRDLDGAKVADFDRLWEFQDWVQRQELAAEREALVSA